MPKPSLEPIRFNQQAWDNIATSSHRWFTPVTDSEIEAARGGRFSLRLTACRSIPPEWIGDVRGKKVLALAAGGGHQGPILAAAGAEVTVVDFSEKQLDIDRQIASRHNLSVDLLQADMANLGDMESNQFDLVINPCSVNFVSDVRAVWQHVARVMRVGGALVAGMIQPVNFLFDPERRDRGKLKVRFRIPYSDLDLPDDQRDQTLGPERPIDFGHSLEDLIGGQLSCGLRLTHLFEDRWGGKDVLSDHIATFLATRSVKHA